MAIASSETGPAANYHGTALSQSRQTRLYVEPEPLRWQEMEALRYYYQAIRPTIKIETGASPVHPQVHHKLYNALSFICIVAAQNITQLRKTHLNFTQPGQDTALMGLWATYHNYAARYIRQINMWIHQEDTRAFGGIMYLAGLDMQLNLLCWQAHMNGYLALVQHLGGVQAVLIATEVRTPAANMHSVTIDLFDTLRDLDLNSWIDQKKWGNFTAGRNLAELYQVATGLYGILSLPQAAVAAAAAAAGHGAESSFVAYHKMRTTYSLKLTALLKKIQPVLREPSVLVWALAVAGVGATSQDTRDQHWIAQQLFVCWLTGDDSFGPISCRNKLRAFWQSGKTAWDDCFDEPIAIVT
ncbi:hypothetical protein PWT90_08267 [Aphanocladium album]|nr:hypothetical protein PWT90_08267 [Aphanocladium album]